MHRKYAQNEFCLNDAAVDQTMLTTTMPTTTMPTTSWESLEQRVDQLIELTAVLSKENRALKVQQHHWSTERAKLIEKNELAKSRIEAMISRLKSLEQD